MKSKIMDSFQENKTFSYSQLQIFLNLASNSKFNLKDEDFNYIAIDCASSSIEALNTILTMAQKNIKIPDNVINATSLNVTKLDITGWRSVHILLELGNNGNICALQNIKTLASEIQNIIKYKINSSSGIRIYNDIINPYKSSKYEIIRNILIQCTI